MAEQAGDKTEAATPRRRQEAREQGNIARSQDLTASVLLIGAMMLLHYTGGTLVGALRAILLESLSAASLGSVTLVSPLDDVVKVVLVAAAAMAPLFGGVVVLAVVVNIAQVGFNLNPARLEPNLGALNPLKGVGKMFGGGNAVALLMGLMKLTLVSLVAYSAVHGRLHQIIAAQQLSYMQIFGLGMEIVYAIAIRIGVLLFVLAIIDYVYQRIRIERDLRMSKQEIKEEMRRMDGDPLMKQRRRQIAMQIAQNKLKKEVPKADVIVTNPTHFAIALKYDPDTMGAPKVIAKGGDFMAKRIREIAIENGIPILERPPMARALFKLCNVGQEIPEQFYSAVAEILAYVYELSGKIKSKQKV
ncbi:MAG TPA: flagellar biosynthesis protein FlhB [Tepidisphaeraceae bacterium]|jgi:flagellar biosynthetic protein FlhB|nr:flagellar biosynthesis protein FlhB [Tepidisphaeraceae bacterium]